MILDIAILIIAFGNLIVAFSLLNVVNNNNNKHNNIIANPIAKIRKKKHEESLTQDEILLRNIEAYDGTDNGQMEI